MILRNEFACYIENHSIINLFLDRMEVKLLSQTFVTIHLLLDSEKVKCQFELKDKQIYCKHVMIGWERG